MLLALACCCFAIAEHSRAQSKPNWTKTSVIVDHYSDDDDDTAFAFVQLQLMMINISR
jgi:hypothetical protein